MSKRSSTSSNDNDNISNKKIRTQNKNKYSLYEQEFVKSVIPLKETSSSSSHSSSGNTVTIATHNKIGYAIDSILIAAYPPKEYDPTSFTFLHHKTEPGVILVILFPDEEAGAKYSSTSASKMIQAVQKDLVESLYQQDIECTVIESLPVKIKMKNQTPEIPWFNPNKLHNYPYYMHFVLSLSIK